MRQLEVAICDLKPGMGGMGMAKRKNVPRATALIPSERIERTILLLRGQKVMLDKDLARLYGVTVGRLNEAVKRNRERFPPDFMFRLTNRENMSLLSQFAIPKTGRGGSRFTPYAFTEQGVAML